MQKIVSISSHTYSVKTRTSFYFLHCHGYVSIRRCRALICRDTKHSVHFCASAGKFMVKTQLENMELFSIPALVSTFDMFDCFVSLEPDF
jgi:hypothetical protein